MEYGVVTSFDEYEKILQHTFYNEVCGRFISFSLFLFLSLTIF
jgi:hypothetical protein